MTALFFLFFRRRIYPVVISPPSSSCHQFRFLLFHFFSFRCDGVAVVQLEKTQEPKEKRHDEVREWGACLNRRHNPVNTHLPPRTISRQIQRWKKTKNIFICRPPMKRKKEDICRRQSWIINGTDRRTRGEGQPWGHRSTSPPPPICSSAPANFLPRIISRGREKRSREENSAQDFRDCTTCNEEEKKERDERIFFKTTRSLN